MLFQSIQFVALFLPALIVGFLVASRFGHAAKVWFLIVASLTFYGVHTAWHVLLLIGSILVNYAAGDYLDRTRSRRFLVIIVAANLLLLGYFKYLTFFTREFSRIFDYPIDVINIVLPIAISFFTFQQIAYVVDSYRGTRFANKFSHYVLFITFFPQLIAGPIVKQQQIIKQIASDKLAITMPTIVFGLSIFTVGLWKKLFLADSFTKIADPVFSAVSSEGSVSIASAWGGILAYTLQIYFDFSAYSDMAIGLAAIFGIILPLNFLSPYKATSPSDFWKRWHITLSEFLQQYLYIPLGGNRVPAYRVTINLMLVMLIGGFWHGAGWSFLLWGFLHGSYLVGYHMIRGRLPVINTRIAIATTFILVTIAWVPFRAGDSDVIPYYASMVGLVTGAEVAINWVAIIVGLLFCWLLPNTAELFGLKEPWSLQWKPSIMWAILVGCALTLCVLIMIEAPPNEFIYFQF